MLGRLAGHLTYANVMATIAVFIAMGGGAYALTLPKNSVGADQIKRNAVGSSELKRGAVKSVDVANGSLLSDDFAAGQLPAGPRGPQGPQGPRGLQGPKGDTGAPPPVEGYQTATLQNDFKMYDELNDTVPDVPVRFWKDPFGVVHIQGAVQRSTAPTNHSTNIFILPVGYRPDAEYGVFAVATMNHDDFDGQQLGIVQISANGRVVYDGGNVGYFPLDGITFKAAG